jgi:FdhD protein
MKENTSHGANRISGVTGVILAGGSSSRMGSNKALLPFQGGLFIEAIYRHTERLFNEVLLVTNAPEQYPFLPCRKVADRFKGMGPLAGIHAGLMEASNPRVLAVACDMPYISEKIIRFLVELDWKADVIIPRSKDGLEPLHALYGKRCLPAMEYMLASGQKRIISFFDRVTVREVGQEKIPGFEPHFSAFWNVNTPEDYYRLREEELLAGKINPQFRRAA